MEKKVKVGLGIVAVTGLGVSVGDNKYKLQKQLIQKILQQK